MRALQAQGRRPSACPLLRLNAVCLTAHQQLDSHEAVDYQANHLASANRAMRCAFTVTS